MPEPNTVCPQCAAPFHVFPSRAAKAKGPIYCSRACQSLAHGNAPAAERPCEGCGEPFRAKPYLVTKGFGRFCSQRCSSLATSPMQPGEANPRWKGYALRGGYRLLPAPPGHPRTTKAGYVAEHILVMEQHIGRYVKPGEHVHHINNVKDDNRIENLALMTKSAHHSLHATLHNPQHHRRS